MTNLITLSPIIRAPFTIDELGTLVSFNTGNMIFSLGARHCINSANIISRRELMERSTPISGPTVITMANHISKRVDLDTNAAPLEMIDGPILIFGIGVQHGPNESPSISDGTIRYLKAIQQRNNSIPSVITRGPVSAKLLNDNGISAVQYGCPSHFIRPVTNLGQIIRSKVKKIDRTHIRLAITAGDPFRKNQFVKDIEHHLFFLARQTHFRYIIQNPKDFISARLFGINGVEQSSRSVIKAFLPPTISGDDLDIWLKDNSTVYISAEQWIADLSSSYDICMGTRIHGCQAALQAGVPSLCIAIDGRMEEFCVHHRIPHIRPKDFLRIESIDGVIEILARWDFNKYDIKRQYLAGKLKQLFARHGVMTSPNLASIIRK
jgi:hypothetical protein